MIITVKKVINAISILISLIILFACIFDLQYSILIGPFLDSLLLSALTIIGLIFAIATIPVNGFKKNLSYIPLILLFMAFMITFFLPRMNFDYYIHYSLNKENLEFINRETKKENIYEMTDMLRYHKRLNEAYLANDFSYKGKNDIEKAFGEYININNLDIDKIVEIQNKLISSNIMSIYRDDDYLILTIDGFIDNEYGYIKPFSKGIQIGECIPPYGLKILKLIKLKNGWYFFYTT